MLPDQHGRIIGNHNLQRIPGEYADHYNTHRPRRTLRQSPPAGHLDPAADSASIQVLRRNRLGA